MRIVDRTTFLALPPGTVFAKWTPHCFQEVQIKWDTMGNDYVVVDLIPGFEGCESGEDEDDIVRAMVAGAASPPLDYDNGGRDGLFDRDQLFAVFDPDDTERLIGALQAALAASAV